MYSAYKLNKHISYLTAYNLNKPWGTRDQIANNNRIIEKASEFQKNIYFCFIDYVIAFDCVDQNKLENS